MTKIIRRYYDDDLQHWVDVYATKNYKPRSRIHNRLRSRMIGAERKIVRETDSIEHNMKIEMKKFINRKEDLLEASKKRS